MTSAPLGSPTRRRVVVLGGYGNFGSRLVDELAGHPGAELVIAGRNGEAARKAAAARGLGHVVCDRTDPASLAAALTGSFLVLHAAGPFQGQGHEVARAALDAGCHMLDLSDGREHVAGLARFDAEARERGLLLAGGASTSPALTDAMVAALAPQFGGLQSIEVGLAPGNRNPRGAATVTAVLSYAGRPVRVFEHGHWTTQLGWGAGRELVFPPPVGRRTCHLCDVPDLELFPGRWQAPTVRFAAGLELPLLDGGLAWLARRRPQHAARFGRLAWAASMTTRWWGSEAGAVAVWLTGVDTAGAPLTRSLALVTEHDGPAAPCAPAVLLARRLLDGGPHEPGPHEQVPHEQVPHEQVPHEQVPPPTGAGPATGLLSLDELHAHLSHSGFVRYDGDEQGWFPPGATTRPALPA